MRLQVASSNPNATPAQLPDAVKYNVNYMPNSKYTTGPAFQSVMHTLSAEQQCIVAKGPPPQHLAVNITNEPARLSLRFQT